MGIKRFIKKTISREESSNPLQNAVKKFSFRDLKGATDDFNRENVIGEGGFGVVYKGCLDGSVVAIKRIRMDNSIGIMQFKTEVDMVSRALHKNLLKLQGFCITSKERLLVYPFMANGSVASRLKGRQESQSPLDWSTRKRVVYGTAVALAYLHESCNPKIIHRDVKPDNILLDEDFEAILADFGFTKLINYKDSHVTTIVCGTIGHIAPEYITNQKCSDKTDVYGYGIFLLELLSGNEVSEIVPPSERDKLLLPVWIRNILTEKRLDLLIDSYLQLSFRNPNLYPEAEDMVNVALQCTQYYPENRPKMSDVVRMLDEYGLNGVSVIKRRVFDDRLKELDQQEIFGGGLKELDHHLDDHSLIGANMRNVVDDTLKEYDQQNFFGDGLKEHDHIVDNHSLVGASVFKKVFDDMVKKKKVFDDMLKKKIDDRLKEIDHNLDDPSSVAKLKVFDDMSKKHDQQKVFGDGLKEHDHIVDNHSLVGASVIKKVFDNRLKKIKTQGIFHDALMGKQSPNTVYKATLDDEHIIAIKRLTKDQIHRANNNSEHYLDIMGKAEHANILTFGAYYKFDGEEFLVYDYLPNGSMSTYAADPPRGQKGIPFDWEQRLRSLKEAARGLLYIHEKLNAVHGNIKSSNVLFDMKNVAHIQLEIPDDAFTVSSVYTAPEQRLSKEADVYSFGVLFLEHLTAFDPSNIHVSTFPKWVRRKYKNLDSFNKSYNEALKVGLRCVARSPEDRPKMMEVIEDIADVERKILSEGSPPYKSSSWKSFLGKADYDRKL